jgi:hypothetical protein
MGSSGIPGRLTGNQARRQEVFDAKTRECGETLANPGA